MQYTENHKQQDMKATQHTLKVRSLIPVIIALVLLTAGCEKGLEPEVYNKISQENYPKNENDVKSAVTGIYSELRKDQAYAYNKGCRIMMDEVVTDEMDCNWDWKDHTDFFFRPETEFVAVFYKVMMPHVTRVTRTIEMVKNVSMDAGLLQAG